MASSTQTFDPRSTAVPDTTTTAPVPEAADGLDQQNAAHSEQSASTAEQLSSQAAELEHMVTQLQAVVGGKNT
ncbi:MAG: hypothetical protein R6U20_08230 [Longimonas sp.]|uniref:hypothetical protein n=1 Tax=Longimonas sp. TaxID=2039626 RepID=UPI003974CEFC